MVTRTKRFFFFCVWSAIGWNNLSKSESESIALLAAKAFVHLAKELVLA
jgi:hypothetical protein